MPLATRLLLAVPLAVIGLNAHAGDLSVVGTGDGIDLLRALGAAYTADHPETNVIVPPSIGSGGGIAAVGSNKEVLARARAPALRLREGSRPDRHAGLPAALGLLRASLGRRDQPDQRAACRRLSAARSPTGRTSAAQDVRIKVVRREDADSTLQVLRQSMPGWKDLAITEKSKTAVTTQDCIDTVKEVPGAIGFGPFTKALEMELVGAQDRRPPSDRPRAIRAP